LSEFDRFVGIPYADKGRGETVDCWGLVQRVFREVWAIDLPSYAERYVTAEDRKAMDALISGELAPWDEVAAGNERTFDVVLMREGRFVRHVGIVTQPGMLLHVSRGETSQIERYGHGPLKHRIVGFYRYREP
jgi:cell wall-associated NlpC family hydrolase